MLHIRFSPKVDKEQTPQDVRFVPKADLRTAADRVVIRSPRRRGRAASSSLRVDQDLRPIGTGRDDNNRAVAINGEPCAQ